MAIFKCKMCGGDLEISEGVTVCDCDYCGTKQTVPTAKDENLHGLYNRANTLRIKAEFDKAEQLYEKILHADESQAEAYWGLILCKYGIEYIEDPKTFKRIPTCHRTSFDSIISDEDYKSALKYADAVQKNIYEQEAKEIDRIQKDIIELSSKEEPYDVFICYKETDSTGSRTQDSAIANDIYYQLTNEGFKVFYAAITLEDKLGSAYEPCIFAALNSAKVMLAVGTKPEYFSAVWVKNEWSRFLKMMKNDRSKMLIPCYKDMDAYELPEEFAHLQAQDMGKIGFVNDIVRGISKVIVKEPQNTPAITETASPAVAPLLERVFLFLEDEEWDSANEYCEKVLDQDPKNATAYLGKLMIDLRVGIRSDLGNLEKTFNSNANYKKLVRFATEDIKSEIEGYLTEIKNRINKEVFESKYFQATVSMERAKNKKQYLSAADAFKELDGYRDSNELYNKCLQKAEDIEKERIYTRAKAIISTAINEYEIDDAIEMLSEISDYSDSMEIIASAKSNWLTLFEKYTSLVANFNLALEAISANQKKEKFESEIKKLNAEITQLKSFASDFSVCTKEIENINNTIRSKNEKITSLQQKKASLGIFSGKQKKEIDATIEDVRKEIGDLNASLPNLEEQKHGYSDITEINEKIDTLLHKISVIETEIEKLQTNSFGSISLEEIVKALLSDEMLLFLSENNDLIEKIQNTPYVSEDITKKIKKAKANISFVSTRNVLGSKKRISAGPWHAMGLKADGSVVAIGDNDYGQCDDVKTWKDIISVSAGEWYGLGLKKDGTVVACGDAEDNRTAAKDWSNIVSISAGEEHAVGLVEDGTVIASGRDDKYIASKWTNIHQISAANNYIVGLKKDGTVVAVGSLDSDSDYGQCNVSDWENITSIAVSNYHTVGLKDDGTVVAVGQNDDGRCKVNNWKNIVEISAGAFHTVGLRNDGTVVAVGDNEYGQCNVKSWKDIISIATGARFTVGLKKDGTVVAVGDNDDGRLNVSDWEDIVSIAAGIYTYGVKKNGTVVIAQEDDSFDLNEVENWSNIVSVSAKGSFAVGLKNDGSVVFAGYDKDGAKNCSNWNNIAYITTTDHHAIGVTHDGRVLVSGDIDKFDVEDWNDIVAISVNSHNTIGLKSDGTVVTAGANGTGVLEEGWEDIIDISCGEKYLIGLKSDGTVVVLNYENDEDYDEENEDEDFEDEDIDYDENPEDEESDEDEDFEATTYYKEWSDIVAVSSGKDHIVGLTSDGSVVAYAFSAYDNRCNVNSWHDVIEISAGDDYTMGLTSNGQVLVASDKDCDKHNCDKWKLF